MGLFTDYDFEESKSLGRKSLGEYDSFIKSLYDPNNPLATRNLEGVTSKFGVDAGDPATALSSIRRGFSARKSSLSTAAANARKGVAARIGGAGATPEFAFGAVDSDYLGALSGLEGAQGEAEVGALNRAQDQRNFRGRFLQSLLGGQTDRELQARGQKQSALNSYLQVLNDGGGSLFDDIASIAGTAALFL